MILTCPQCTARFSVNPREIGPQGRRVRCGKCKQEWLAEAPLITQPAVDINALLQNPMVAAAVVSAEARVSIEGVSYLPPMRSAMVGAMAAFVILLPFLTLKILPHVHGVATPRAKVAVKAETIVLEGTPTTMLRQEEGRPVLSIEGVLVNKTGSLQKVPVLKASALNALGTVVREWTIPLSSQQLEAGQRLPFSFITPLSDQGVEDIAFNLL